MSNYLLTSLLSISMSTLLVGGGQTPKKPIITTTPSFIITPVTEKPTIFYGAVWEITPTEDGKFTSKLKDQFKAKKVIAIPATGGFFYIDADTNETYQVTGHVVIEITEAPSDKKPKFLIEMEK